MDRYISGDAHAFDELYSHAAPPLLSYLIRMSGRRALAEDVLQETFIKVHRARSTYIAKSNPMPWLYAIAHRSFLDHARKHKRQKQKLEEVRSEAGNQHAHITGVPGDQVHAPDPEAAQAIRRALTKLAPPQRQAIVLCKLEGKTLAEAAEITGTSVGAMKLRVHRGVARLRTLLSQGEHDGA